MDKLTQDNLTLVHHDDNDVVEIIVDGHEGTERMWFTYEELASLKKLLKVIPEYQTKQLK